MYLILGLLGYFVIKDLVEFFFFLFVGDVVVGCYK